VDLCAPHDCMSLTSAILQTVAPFYNSSKFVVINIFLFQIQYAETFKYCVFIALFCHICFLLMLTNVQLSMLVFWVAMSCGLAGRYRCFRRTHSLHLLRWKLEAVCSSKTFIPTGDFNDVTAQNNLEIFTTVKI
jgi:hypothetical protein